MISIRRDAARIVQEMANVYPTLTIAGPRHAGKTTLTKILFPRHRYVNLEDPDVRDFARRRPDEFLKHYTGNLLIDEFRLAPELIPRIRAATPYGGKWPGRFILTTSYREPAKPGVLQPPVREPATFTLLPLSIRELVQAKYGLDRDRYIVRGFMPPAYKTRNADPQKVYGEIYSQYMERDVKRLINLENPDAFERFLKKLAGSVGQIMNLNTMADDVGVSQTTLTTWISILEASFVVFKLQPYFDDFGRRIVKTPKLYFTDVGMAAYLLGMTDPEQLPRDPFVGNLFENMVVTETLKSMYNSGRKGGLYYFRNQNRLEVDLLLTNGGKITPMEIKYGETFNSAFARNIMLFRKLSGRIRRGRVVYSGEYCVKKSNEELPEFWNFKDMWGAVEGILDEP
jgi:predicted AAA+ superfamily ATPase